MELQLQLMEHRQILTTLIVEREPFKKLMEVMIFKIEWKFSKLWDFVHICIILLCLFWFTYI